MKMKVKWDFHTASARAKSWVRMNELLQTIHTRYPRLTQLTAEELIERFQFIESFRTCVKAEDICFNLDVDPHGRTLARDPMKGCVAVRWANDVITLLDLDIVRISQSEWCKAQPSDEAPAGTIYSYNVIGINFYALVGHRYDENVINYAEGTAAAQALELPGSK